MTATMRPTDPGRVRPAAVAGAFYPADPTELAAMVDEALAAAERADLTVSAAAAGSGEAARAAGSGRARPEALIVPHAGYVYSGPVAAAAYARLRPWRDRIESVVLIGPAHRVPVHSMAVSSAAGWDTPLGRVPLDGGSRDRILAVAPVVVDDDAHAPEHSLEVELPFLQQVLGHPFQLLPVVIGQAAAEDVAAMLDEVWGGDETLVVVSSDLSHYEVYDEAAAHDRRTAGNIVARRLDQIGPRDACGAFAVRGLLALARARDLEVELVDLRSSGDTTGPANRVVGYGAFVAHAAGGAGLTAERATGAIVDEGPPASPAGGDTPDGNDLTSRSVSSSGGAAAVLATSGDDRSRPAPPPIGDAGRHAARFSGEEEAWILAVAADAIRARLENREAGLPGCGDAPPRLSDPAATFVTLRDGSRLLGCIGSIEARRPLLGDVADNAVGAAFRDPRMPPVSPNEFGRMSIHVSVLTRPEPFRVRSVTELLESLVPGQDGLLIEAGRKRATFLPSVWRQVPDPADFQAQLWRKAGLADRSWPRRLRVWRYQASELGDEGPRRPITSVTDRS